MEQLRVNETFDSERLDVVLATHEKVSSRSEAQRIIKSGSITINRSAGKINPKLKVKSGDLIEFAVPASPPATLTPVAHPLDIVYEDDCLIVVNKPSGMVVHPSAGHHSDTLVNYLLHHSSLAANDPIRPGIVHRIDKDTSGLLVIAKDLRTHEHLAKQFFVHSIERRYEALVWGILEQTSGIIEKPIGRHPTDRKKFAVRAGGKEAITHWKVLKRLIYLSLIECRLETGRTHQIRVHLNALGHPLLGDAVYGRYRNYVKKLPERIVTRLKQFQGQALHAKTLGFIHPANEKWIVFTCQRPVNMQKVIDDLSHLSEEAAQQDNS